MKKLIFNISTILLVAFSNAQVPQALNYQAVARTSQGQIIPAQSIGVRFSILDGSVTGSAVYQETQTTTTNNFGLFTLAIGNGSIVSGTFSLINWETGDKFLKVEIAPQGGTDYQLQGTTQLLSVPYALYSEKTKLIAGNAISITNGNTISANYQPGIGINITGVTISHNLKAGTGIRINQDSIVGNYQAGGGINITGNVISAPGNNLWTPDANGMHNQSGFVGIGTPSVFNTTLSLLQTTTGVGGNAAMDITSNDTWHTIYRFRNQTMNQEYQFIIAGSGNIDDQPGSFGIFHATNNLWLINSDRVTSNIAIGSYNYKSQIPKSRLHIFNGDVNINDIGSGIIMKSPNGQCWRVTVSNTGTFVATAIACP
jgi:hypothetical protein